MNKPNELYHHGIMGMKWGVRRYQNEDGSLTPAGERHRDSGSSSNGSGHKHSLKGNLHRLAAWNYGVNERYYRKRGKNLYASMNASARKDALRNAEKADAAAAAKREKKTAKTSQKKRAKIERSMNKARTIKVRESNKHAAKGRKKVHSLKGNLHRLAAWNYGVNERYYKKRGKNLYASMNASARRDALRNAEKADAAAAAKKRKKGVNK